MPIKLIFLVIFVGVVSFGAYWFSQVDLVEDKTQPEIVLEETPRGLGLEPFNLKVKISDQGAGIDRFIVTLRQRGFSKELFRAALKGAKEYNFQQELIADRGYLVEGLAELEFRVLDRSLSGNVNVLTIPIQIDFKKPQINIVSSMHNLHLGGIQLAFYEVRESALDKSGVRVGDLFFYGFPARFFDASLKSKELYVAIYSVPQDVQAKPRLFATDLAGNYVEAAFYNMVLRRKFSPLRVSAKSADVLRALGNSMPGPLSSDSEKLSEQVAAARELANQKISNALETAKPERKWKGTFRQGTGSVRTSFGSRVRLVDKQNEQFSYLEAGYAYSGDLQDKYVYAPNSGEVILAENIPFYGQVVVLNHGMRLNSLSGNLDEISVRVGERVHAGQVIGTRSPQGIFGAGTFFYELRVGATPVEPREWWDANWVRQHIENKISEVKVTMGL